MLVFAVSGYIPSAAAQAEIEAPTVEVIGHYESGIGTSDASSQGSVNSKQLMQRPTLGTGEVLELVPGMTVTQHSGSGKANQYYLRGFNLDHGTDFAVHLDGMPANMRSHGHGQGYADINFMIPELVARVDFHKGPYFAEEGDFASAGAAHFRLFDQVKHGLGGLTLGTDRYLRGLVVDSTPAGPGKWLYAMEWNENEGPWVNPENLRKLNGVLRYSQGEGGGTWSLTAMAYRANWDATDQIPKRAVASGLLDRFGAVDPSDGGESERYSLSANLRRASGAGQWNASAYFIQYSLGLWSNFTYFLSDPVNADQFQQTDQRRVYGGQADYRWATRWGGADMENRAGLQLRYDDIGKVGLYKTRNRQFLSLTREDAVNEGSAGLFAENFAQWKPWLRTVLGLRADFYQFDVVSNNAANSGSLSDHIASPKLAVVLGPWSNTEFFVNYGQGFHSNDARGTVITVDPSDGLTPVQRVTPLVRTKGGELGARTQFIQGVQSSLALWRLDSASELLFVGDAGATLASRPSTRQGAEWITSWRAAQWLSVEVDLALSKSRFTGADPAGGYIPGSPERTLQVGFYVEDLGPWSAALQVRHFGPRPLIEDNSVRSGSTTLTNLRLVYEIDKLQLRFDVLNLFGRRDSDVEYYYCSRLAGETPGVCADGSAGVDGIHFHPVEPRQFRLALNLKF
ncbi:MAG: TonB-dependent receptor [Burkholderiales bacterium]